MRVWIMLPLAGLLLLAAGCHLHPLPDHVVGLETHAILHKIRCEAKAAVEAILKGSLRRYGVYDKLDRRIYPTGVLADAKGKYTALSAQIEYENDVINALRRDAEALNAQSAQIKTRKELNELRKLSRFQEIDRRAQQPGSDIRKALKDIAKQKTSAVEEHVRENRQIKRVETQFKLDRLASDARVDAQNKKLNRLTSKRDRIYKEFKGFMDHRLAYQVEFKIKENNTVASEASFRIPLLLGSVTIDDIDPADERERSGNRSVSVVASFKELVETKCDEPLGSDGSSFVPRYPIEGKVGLKEIIEQYMKLAHGPTRTILFSEKTDPGFSDKITFKTTIRGGAAPSVAITQAGHTFTGKIDLSGSRTDEHILFVRVSHTGDEFEKDKGKSGERK